jgi:hypothetical protein
MEITYTWVIDQMATKPQEGDLVDVVANVTYRRVGVTINGELEYSSRIIGVFNCETPSPTDFTAYPDLTYDQVCGWLDAGLNVTDIDANIALGLETQINPPIIVLPNPWETPNI